MEHLSEQAEAVPAFIRQHPSMQEELLIAEFHYPALDLSKALVPLCKGLVEAKSDVWKGEFPHEATIYLIRFFPKY